MFHISFMKKSETKKKQMNKSLLMLEFKASNNKQYKIKTIQDSSVYAKKANGYLSGLYYLIT